MAKNTYVAIEQAAILLKQLCSQVNQAALGFTTEHENVIISFEDVLPTSGTRTFCKAVIVSEAELNELREAQNELAAIKAGNMAEAMASGKRLRSATIPELYQELGFKLGMVQRPPLNSEGNPND
jgi:hypothetical protein